MGYDRYDSRVDWHGIALALGQLKELSAPSDLDKFYAKKESDAEQFEIEKEYELDKARDSRQWELVKMKAESSVDQIENIHTKIQAEKDKLIAIDDSLGKVAGTINYTPGAQNILNEIDVTNFDTMGQAKDDMEQTLADDMMTLKRAQNITNMAHYGKSVAQNQTENFYVSPNTEAWAQLKQLDTEGKANDPNYKPRFTPIEGEDDPNSGKILVKEWDISGDDVVSEDEYEFALQNLLQNFDDQGMEDSEGFEDAFRGQIKRKDIKEDLKTTIDLGDSIIGDYDASDVENIDNTTLINIVKAYQQEVAKIDKGDEAALQAWSTSQSGKDFQAYRDTLMRRGLGHKMMTYDWDAAAGVLGDKKWVDNLQENFKTESIDGSGFDRTKYDELMAHSPELKETMELYNFWRETPHEFPHGGKAGLDNFISMFKEYAALDTADKRKKYLDKVKAQM